MMKNNNHIWSNKQIKAYYKISGLYAKLLNIEDTNEFEKHLFRDVSKVQGMFDLLKRESDMFDYKRFNEDFQLLNLYLSYMVQEMDSRTGCLENKKFSLLVLDYFISSKPLLK